MNWDGVAGDDRCVVAGDAKYLLDTEYLLARFQDIATDAIAADGGRLTPVRLMLPGRLGVAVSRPPAPARYSLMPFTQGHIYLAKASDKLVSHCRCADGLITFPPQMDCPWCGCGWLFTCIGCGKAFTFAKGIEVPEPWEETAKRDLRRWGKEPPRDRVSEWVEAMKELLRDVNPGEEYVCLDGMIIPTTATSVCFEGWHSRHDLPFVPQVAALQEPSVLDSTLGDRDYWERSAVERAGE